MSTTPKDTGGSSETPPPSAPKGLMDVDGRLTEKVVLDDKEEVSRVEWSMLRLVAPAMAVIVAGVIASFTVPALEWARPHKQGDPYPFWNVTQRPFQGEETAIKEEQVAKVDSIAREALAEDSEPIIEVEHEPVVVPENHDDALPAYLGHPDDDKPIEQPIELGTGNELDGFFEQLARSDHNIEGAITRVVHWGDSSIGADGITSAIRKRMQARFGDSGHGFHAMAPPNTSYRHYGVKFSHNEQWELCFIIRKCRSDGYYGLAGVDTRSSGGGISFFAPDARYNTGHVSRFEIWHAGDPRGGKIRYRLDRESSVVFETRSETLEDRWEVIETEDAPHKLKVEAVGGGRARVYGVVMERDVPGIVWDGLALVGAFTKRMLEFDEAHFRSQVQHRNPQLAVFTFGGNDMVRDSMTMEQYTEEFSAVIQRLRDASPETSCIIMSPLDHGIRQGVRIVSLPVVPEMVEAQRQLANAKGCAFFDTYSAMGGDGSAGRWFKQEPRLISGDLSHVTYKGQVVLGEMFYRALMQRYVEYRKREK